jgi:hypothetical protein
MICLVYYIILFSGAILFTKWDQISTLKYTYFHHILLSQHAHECMCPNAVPLPLLLLLHQSELHRLGEDGLLFDVLSLDGASSRSSVDFCARA